MLEASENNQLPAIPGKRYFTIGEVSDLCGVKPHVLRYWEQEFPDLSPVKRRGNRRYYQRQDVVLIRQIRSLLHEQGFTIGGARQKLGDSPSKKELTPYKQLLDQTISELEDILKLSINSEFRGVAQPGSALHWGCSGRRFKSCRPDHDFY